MCRSGLVVGDVEAPTRPFRTMQGFVPSVVFCPRISNAVPVVVPTPVKSGLMAAAVAVAFAKKMPEPAAQSATPSESMGSATPDSAALLSVQAPSAEHLSDDTALI